MVFINLPLSLFEIVNHLWIKIYGLYKFSSFWFHFYMSDSLVFIIILSYIDYSLVFQHGDQLHVYLNHTAAKFSVF